MAGGMRIQFVSPRLLQLLQRNLVNLIIAISPVAFWQPALDAFGPAQSMAVKSGVSLLFAIFMLIAVIGQKALLKKTPVIIPAVLYLAACLAATIFSINKGVSLKYFYEMALFIGGAYLIYAVSGRDGLKRILVLIVAVHTLMSLYGIFQHFGMDPFKWSSDFGGRPLGTIGNPNFFAGQLLVSVFILAAYMFYPGKNKIAAAIALAINLACLYFTKVFGAFFGMAFGAFFAGLILVYSYRQELKLTRKKTLIIAAAAAVVMLLSSPLVFKMIGKIYEIKKRSFVHRVLMWEAGWLMIKEAPVAGKGLGGYRLNYPYYQGLLLNNPKNNEYDYVVTWMPHQNYILIASETGIMGLGLFLLMTALFFAQSLKTLSEKNRDSAAALGMAGATAALLGASFFNTFYNVASSTFYYFLFIFSIFALTRDEQKYFAVKGTALKAAAAGAALLFALTAVYDWRVVAANIYLKQANRAFDRMKDAQAKQSAWDYETYKKEAGQKFEKVIKMNITELCPQTDVAQYYYAAEYFRTIGDLPRALENYARDLELNPFCPEVNNMYGALLGQSGNLDRAVALLKTAVFVAPHYFAACKNLATAFVGKGDIESARAALKTYLEKNEPIYQKMAQDLQARQAALAAEIEPNKARQMASDLEILVKRVKDLRAELEEAALMAAQVEAMIKARK